MDPLCTRASQTHPGFVVSSRLQVCLLHGAAQRQLLRPGSQLYEPSYGHRERMYFPNPHGVLCDLELTLSRTPFSGNPAILLMFQSVSRVFQRGVSHPKWQRVL